MTQNRDVFIFQIGMGWNHFPRNDKDMSRRLRVDISKGQALIVFVNDVRGDLPVDDFEKKVVLIHSFYLPYSLTHHKDTKNTNQIRRTLVNRGNSELKRSLSSVVSVVYCSS